MATPLKLFSRKSGPRLLYCQVRHKFVPNKANVKPRAMDRRVFEAITEPILPEPLTYLKYSCKDPSTNQIEEPNPYEEFLIRQLKKLIDESQMLIICHRLPCSNVALRETSIDFKLEGIKTKILNNTHVKMLIKDTDKANLSYLLTGNNVLLYSPDVRLKEAWSILRKTPKLVPLGGFCCDRLFTKDQLQSFSKLPPIEQLLGELVSCLNLIGGSKTSSLLTSHQQTLSANLQQYHKQKSEES